MAALPPLPVTVVGGYLGAGKTTLVNHLLRHAGGRRIAVLVNDFGQLPIDADLILGSAGDVVAIAGGCVCCAYGSDLMAALETMAARRPRPDHVVVEASGVALPDGIALSVELLASYRRGAVVVLADAETVRRHAADRYVGDTIDRQLAAADLVIVNKTDLVDAAALDATLEWLAAAAPRAAVTTARGADVPLEAVLGLTETDRPLRLRRPAHAPAAWDATAVAVGHPVDAERLARMLASPEMGLVRAKGVVRDHGGGSRVIQVVGRRWAVTPATAEGTTGRLVAITAGHPVPAQAIAAALAEAAVAQA